MKKNTQIRSIAYAYNKQRITACNRTARTKSPQLTAHTEESQLTARTPGTLKSFLGWSIRSKQRSMRSDLA